MWYWLDNLINQVWRVEVWCFCLPTLSTEHKTCNLTICLWVEIKLEISSSAIPDTCSSITWCWWEGSARLCAAKLFVHHNYKSGFVSSVLQKVQCMDNLSFQLLEDGPGYIFTVLFPRKFNIYLTIYHVKYI